MLTCKREERELINVKYALSICQTLRDAIYVNVLLDRKLNSKRNTKIALKGFGKKRKNEL